MWHPAFLFFRRIVIGSLWRSLLHQVMILQQNASLIVLLMPERRGGSVRRAVGVEARSVNPGARLWLQQRQRPERHLKKKTGMRLTRSHYQSVRNWMLLVQLFRE